jgi:hypothetical protein
MVFMVRKQCLGFFATLVVVVLGVGACKSTPDTIIIPMTPQLIEEVGPENMSKLSYYLSKEVKLERQDYFRKEVQFNKGIAFRVDKNVKDIIVIEPKTPGAAALNMLAEASYVNYRVLGIVFEDSSTSKVGFAVDLADPEGRFDILLDDEEEGTIQYGNHIYRVVYSGDERPYLKVRIGKNIIREDLYRKASGRPIE